MVADYSGAKRVHDVLKYWVAHIVVMLAIRVTLFKVTVKESDPFVVVLKRAVLNAVVR